MGNFSTICSGGSVEVRTGEPVVVGGSEKISFQNCFESQDVQKCLLNKATN